MIKKYLTKFHNMLYCIERKKIEINNNSLEKKLKK
jgi:hypothetical protein